MFGKIFINVLSQEVIQGYEKDFITPEIIQNNMNSTPANFYVCGPPPLSSRLHIATLAYKE